MKPSLPVDLQPAVFNNGLAIYSWGTCKPLLLMPYPHGFGRAPIVQEALAAVFYELKQRVVSFDPPGTFNTTRSAQVSMSEMLGCAEETLAVLEISEPLTLVGHSMGGFCAIAYALAHPERVKRVIIVGSLAGASAIQRHDGLPWGSWLTGRDRFHYIYWGFRLSWGLRGNLALIGVGRLDPQAPVGCSEEIARGIPGARLVIFEHSGHYPFAEERDRFKQTLADFLA